MKELEKSELMEVDGGKIHPIMWYLGYAYQKAVQREYEVDIYLTFI